MVISLTSKSTFKSKSQKNNTKKPYQNTKITSKKQKSKDFANKNIKTDKTTKPQPIQSLHNKPSPSPHNHISPQPNNSNNNKRLTSIFSRRDYILSKHLVILFVGDPSVVILLEHGDDVWRDVAQVLIGLGINLGDGVQVDIRLLRNEVQPSLSFLQKSALQPLHNNYLPPPGS